MVACLDFVGSFDGQTFMEPKTSLSEPNLSLAFSASLTADFSQQNVQTVLFCDGCTLQSWLPHELNCQADNLSSSLVFSPALLILGWSEISAETLEKGFAVYFYFFSPHFWGREIDRPSCV
jgi:hypothetical protein